MDKEKFTMWKNIVMEKMDTYDLSESKKKVVLFTIENCGDTDEERQECISMVGVYKIKEKIPTYKPEDMHMVTGLNQELARFAQVFDDSYYVKNMYTRRGQKLYESGYDWTEVIIKNCLNNMKDDDFKNPKEKVEDTE